MKRSLALVLNGKQSNIMLAYETIFLVLETMESKELDEYISKNFNSSSEVRAKYSSKIKQFLDQNREFITRVQKENDRRFEGSIVILENSVNSKIERKKVVYKKDMVLFKKITDIKRFVLEIEKRDYINSQSAMVRGEEYNRIFSQFHGNQIRFYCDSDNKYNKIIGQWRNELKKTDYYYDIVRQILNEYENRYRELALESLDVIYSNYLNEKNRNKNANNVVDTDYINKEEENIELEPHSEEILNPIYQEPKRYPKVYDEEGYPGDLEDWSVEGHYDEDYNPYEGLEGHEKKDTAKIDKELKKTRYDYKWWED